MPSHSNATGPLRAAWSLVPSSVRKMTASPSRVKFTGNTRGRPPTTTPKRPKGARARNCKQSSRPSSSSPVRGSMLTLIFVAMSAIVNECSGATQGRWSRIGGSVVPSLGRQLGGEHRGFGSPLHPQLREQVGHVVLHRLLGQEEAFTDLAIRKALRDEIENLALLIGEPSEPRILLWTVAHPFQNAGRHARVEKRLARSHAADGIDEISPLDLFQEIAGRTGHDRVEQRLVVGERRQDQALDRAIDRT